MGIQNPDISLFRMVEKRFGAKWSNFGSHSKTRLFRWILNGLLLGRLQLESSNINQHRQLRLLIYLLRKFTAFKELSWNFFLSYPREKNPKRKTRKKLHNISQCKYFERERKRVRQRSLEEKVTRFWLKIAKFVATVNKNIFQTPQMSTSKPYKLVILGKKLSPKASKNRQIWSHWRALASRVAKKIIENHLNYWHKFDASYGHRCHVTRLR